MDLDIFYQSFFSKTEMYTTSQSSTLAEINHQAVDKARLNLTQRFLSPIELLTRYYTFHANCEVIVPDDRIEHDVHVQRAREFEEALELMQIGGQR